MFQQCCGLIPVKKVVKNNHKAELKKEIQERKEQIKKKDKKKGGI